MNRFEGHDETVRETLWRIEIEVARDRRRLVNRAADAMTSQFRDDLIPVASDVRANYQPDSIDCRARRAAPSPARARSPQRRATGLSES